MANRFVRLDVSARGRAGPGELLVYSVDRSQARTIGRAHSDGLTPSQQTKWHRARPEDEALAACSARIVLNVEDGSPQSSPVVGVLCQRCCPQPTDQGHL